MKSTICQVVWLILFTSSCISPNNQQIQFSEKKVYSMLWQDDTYLWIRNDQGIARWDIPNKHLDTFDNFSQNCQLALTKNPKLIWCGNSYYDGLQWHHFDYSVRQVVQTKDGNIWTGSNDGLMQYDAAHQNWKIMTKTLPHTSQPFMVNAGYGVHVALASNDNALWFISSDSPYNGTTRWKEASYHTYQLSEWGNSLLYPTLEASDNTVWGVGNDGLVANWTGSQWRTWRVRIESNRYPPIKDVIEDKNGSIWALAEVDGVARWSNSKWEVWNKADIIGDEKDSSTFVLTSISLTLDGDLWVGTKKNGISRWDGNEWKRYTTINGLSSEFITALTLSPSKVLWAGTSDSGINYYNPEVDRWIPFP